MGIGGGGGGIFPVYLGSFSLARGQPQSASTDPGRWCLIKSTASKRVGRFGKLCWRVGVDSPSSARCLAPGEAFV